MASRITFPPSKRFYMGATTIAGKVAIGATGAVGTLSMKGVLSIVRGGVGLYTITLRDSYKNLVWADAMVLHSSDHNLHPQFTAEDVDGSTPTLTLQCYDLDDGAAEEIPEGATLFIKIDLSNSKTGIA